MRLSLFAFVTLNYVKIIMSRPEENRLGKLQEEMKRDFQQRYKYRSSSKGSQLSDDSRTKIRNHSQVKPVKKNKHRLRALLDQSDLSQTLHHLNFSHHSQTDCLCNECNCGRHLCKLNVIKPDLRKQTNYQRSFLPKSAAETTIVKAQPYDKLQGNHLDMNTQYLKEFTDRIKDKLERPKPLDRLRFQGPSQSITTYGQFHPGHHGQNQYVKPTDRHTRGEFPLNATTTYAKNFYNKKYSKEGDLKVPDHLKTGTNWFGNTTYHQFYKQPNPEDYTSIRERPTEKYSPQQDSSYHYQTQYQKNFKEMAVPVCPAKIHIKANSTLFQGSKHNFLENSDFRSMSPQFKAIATSKHFFV